MKLCPYQYCNNDTYKLTFMSWIQQQNAVKNGEDHLNMIYATCPKHHQKTPTTMVRVSTVGCRTGWVTYYNSTEDTW